jgi:hypothetical protein
MASPSGYSTTPSDHTDQQGVCTTCRASLRFCLACGKPIGELARASEIFAPYYEFDGIGPYCETCYHERPPCDLCGAPRTDEHWLLSDGRILCAHCHSTAIYAPAAASALYEEMKALAAKHLSLTLNIPTGLALVDRNQLSQVLRVGEQPASKLPDPGPEKETTREFDSRKTLGVYARRGMRRGIYIQSGLPRMLFLQVAAHEYAHAWQGENCPVLKDELVHEGFAEWVAYQVIGFYGYSKGQQRMLGREDIYGRGLKWALDIEASLGIPGVVEVCRRAA